MVIIQATTYESEPIQMMHIRKVSGNHRLNLGRSQSGIVKRNTRWMGHVTIQVI